jgi:cob(I)alamin adenosyltransferase
MLIDTAPIRDGGMAVRIYTRTGDGGETGLLGGRRVRKSVLRVEAYGELDELNACLGLAATALTDAETVELLIRIQRQIFALSARVADARAREASAEKAAFPETNVEALERAIDAAEATLLPLKAFVLPGGSDAAARLHVARTVCRRAERRLVALAAQDDVPPVFLAYLNRLSDLLFVLARAANHRAGVPDIPW